MTKLTFYHQVRLDGGRRTGISIDDDNESLQYFQAGSDEMDPRLLWYVDVRCRGETLPNDPRKAFAWFSENEDWLLRVMRQTASDVEAGMDAGVWPYLRELTDVPEGVQCSVLVHAGRRLAGREIAAHLLALAGDVRSLLEQLAPLALT